MNLSGISAGWAMFRGARDGTLDADDQRTRGMLMIYRRIAALLGVTALLVAASCTGGDSHPTAAGASGAAALGRAADAANRVVTSPSEQSRATGSTVATRVALKSSSDTARQPGGKSSRTGRRQATTIVRGGYVNDPGCSFGTVEPTSDPTTFTVECEGLGALWNGGFTGHTLVKLAGTIDLEGNFSGTYEDWFYGTYTGDDTFGELHFRGTFSVVVATGEFRARAEIVDGTCGFEGSSGSAAYDGHSINGGYVAEWIRPATPPSPDPTCNPIDPDSLPLREQTSRMGR